MNLAEEIKAQRPNDSELSIIAHIFGHPEELQADHRVHFDQNKSGPGVTPLAILKYLRRQPFNALEAQECYYFIEALPIHLMEVAADLWVFNYSDRPANISWNDEGF